MQPDLGNVRRAGLGERGLLLSFVLLASCVSRSSADAGVDLGLVPECVGGALVTCTDHSYVPICPTGTCATCTPEPDARVVCGAPTPFDDGDGGRTLRCVADPATAPAAVCMPGCDFAPGGCGVDSGRP